MDMLSANNYVIVDNFLSQELYEHVRAHFLTCLPAFSDAGIGTLHLNTIQTEIRGDRTYWLEPKKEAHLSAFWELIEATISMLNRYCYLSLSGYEFHFADYPPGGHYERHVDQFLGRNNRIISMVIYLNPNWHPGDGGELELEDLNGNSVVVEPIARRCVLFKSAAVPHRVLRANKHRHSLTGWLLYKPEGLSFLG